jgi:resuscitation-promoting factor RpfB
VPPGSCPGAFYPMNRPLFKVLGSLLLAGALAVIYLNTRATLTLHADGEQHIVRTHAATVGEALHEAGISVYPEDLIQPAPETKLPPGSQLGISIDRAFRVRVEAEGQTRWIRTQLTSPPAILGSLGVRLSPEDEILSDGVRYDLAFASTSIAPREIVVRPAITFSVTDQTGTAQIRTAAHTVGEALWQAGYRLYAGDEIVPSLDSPVTALLTVTIHRSQPLLIQADGQTLQTRSQRATVGEVLSDLGLALVGQDYSVPALDQPLPTGEGALIRIVRVREEILTEEETIPYETTYQALADSEIDTIVQVQAGVNGLKQHRTRVRYENEMEISRVVEDEAIVQPPTSRVLGYGAKIVVRTLDTPDGPIEYWRAYTMYATSYSPARSGTPVTAKWYGRTASGKMLTKGLVAIDRRLIPFDTSMYVPSYGFALAADTGGGVKGRWIDLGYDDFNYVSWHRSVTVYFLTPIPPANRITWIIPSTIP